MLVQDSSVAIDQEFVVYALASVSSITEKNELQSILVYDCIGLHAHYQHNMSRNHHTLDR